MSRRDTHMQTRTQISRRTFVRWGLLTGAGILWWKTGSRMISGAQYALSNRPIRWCHIHVLDLCTGRSVAHARVEIAWRLDRRSGAAPEAHIVARTDAHGRVRIPIPETARYRPELHWQIQIRRAPYFARMVWPGSGWAEMPLFWKTGLPAVRVSPPYLHMQIPVLPRGPSLPFLILFDRLGSGFH